MLWTRKEYIHCESTCMLDKQTFSYIMVVKNKKKKGSLKIQELSEVGDSTDRSKW